MDKLLQDIDRVYTGIQNLKMQPNKHNVAIVLDTLTVLESVYSYLQDRKEGDKPNGNGTVEQRDSD